MAEQEHKINTITIVQYADDDLLSVTCFTDPDGGTEAEEHFRQIIEETLDEPTEEEIKACLDEGYLEQGTFQAWLTTSD